jgi:hypothetical protein
MIPCNARWNGRYAKMTLRIVFFYNPKVPVMDVIVFVIDCPTSSPVLLRWPLNLEYVSILYVIDHVADFMLTSVATARCNSTSQST